MSSSTAAAGVAASPAVDNNTSLSTDTSLKSNPRRRPMVVIERRLRANVVENGVTNGAAEDKMVVSGNDLIHTTRAESVVERTKDLSRSKKCLSASPGMTSRQKKSAARPEKVKWQTVLSVLTKNCLLLAVLLWLGQNVWRWTYSRGDNSNSPFAVFDYEERVAEVEASLKKTSKMLQVQLDVVDKKIGNEMGVVTKELSKQLTEKGALLEEELKRLESKINSLDSSVGELKEMGLISREEFERQWNELKNRNNSDGNESNLNLDQIRAFARSIVEKEIEKHAADGLGRVDYALASGGARVVRHSEPYVTGKGNTWFSAAKSRNGVHANAHKMLDPSFGEPGQCFPLQGSSGFVEIRLRSGIIPQAVTLEHVSKTVAYDRSSAPKDCQVSAWFESPDEESSSRGQKIMVLTDFSYDLQKSNVQTFDIETKDFGIVNMVRLDYTSNHGNPSLTCIYRFRVHGYEPSSPAAMSSEV